MQFHQCCGFTLVACLVWHGGIQHIFFMDLAIRMLLITCYVKEAEFEVSWLREHLNVRTASWDTSRRRAVTLFMLWVFG